MELECPSGRCSTDWHTCGGATPCCDSLYAMPPTDEPLFTWLISTVTYLYFLNIYFCIYFMVLMVLLLFFLYLIDLCSW